MARHEPEAPGRPDDMSQALVAAVEQGAAITTLISSLRCQIGSAGLAELAEESERERQALLATAEHALRRSDALAEGCVRALCHLRNLEQMLDSSISECADACRVLADRLAVAAEFDLRPRR